MNLPIRPLGDYWQLLQKHGLLSSAQPLSADLCPGRWAGLLATHSR
jgi:hypothetical protein